MKQLTLYTLILFMATTANALDLESVKSYVEFKKNCSDPFESYYSCDYIEPLSPMFYFANKHRVKLEQEKMAQLSYEFKTESLIGKAIYAKYHPFPQSKDNIDEYQPTQLQGSLARFQIKMYELRLKISNTKNKQNKIKKPEAKTIALKLIKG
jgi:hypothetical protein